MDMFTKDAPGLEAVVEMVEKEFPTAIWAVGKCRCDDAAGAYAGTIQSEDFAVIGVVLRANGYEHAVQGWAVHTHAATAVDALGLAYGKAMGEGRS